MLTCRRLMLGGLVLISGLVIWDAPMTEAADGPFAPLIGAWNGSGQIKFSGGSSEALKCRAYYTAKDANAVGLSIRCASTSAKIELRANLNSASGAVSGTWEERTFNAMGQVSGHASPNRLNLAVSGGGFSATMAVGISGANHTVSIQTQGVGFTNVSINMAKG